MTSLSDTSVKPASQGPRHTTAILAVILVSYFMILLDNSIIFTALTGAITATLDMGSVVLIGAGQGLAFAPLTSAGIADVSARDAGAASGLVNTFHQLGSALGLGVLVAVSASSGHGLTSATAVLSAHVDTALSAGTVLLAACLAAVLALILPAHLARSRSRQVAPQCEQGTATNPAGVLARA